MIAGTEELPRSPLREAQQRVVQLEGQVKRLTAALQSCRTYLSVRVWMADEMKHERPCTQTERELVEKAKQVLIEVGALKPANPAELQQLGVSEP